MRPKPSASIFVKRRTCYKPQKPEKLKYGKSRSKVGFSGNPESRSKIGQKYAKIGFFFFFRTTTYFLPTFDLLSGFPENLLLTCFSRILICRGLHCRGPGTPGTPDAGRRGRRGRRGRQGRRGRRGRRPVSCGPPRCNSEFFGGFGACSRFVGPTQVHLLGLETRKHAQESPAP